MERWSRRDIVLRVFAGAERALAIAASYLILSEVAPLGLEAANAAAPVSADVAAAVLAALFFLSGFFSGTIFGGVASAARSIFMMSVLMLTDGKIAIFSRGVFFTIDLTAILQILTGACMFDLASSIMSIVRSLSEAE